MLVIGAGVAGLTGALCLRRRGFAVTVVADRFAPNVTSVVAGALWEWPPAVCGHHRDEVSLGRSKGWAATSYEIFTDLARDPATGVFLRPATFYAKRPIEDDERLHAKVEELEPRVRRFRRDPALIAENGVNPGLGLRDVYSYLAPMIDTDSYLHWLLEGVREAGCTIEERRIAGALRGQEEALSAPSWRRGHRQLHGPRGRRARRGRDVPAPRGDHPHPQRRAGHAPAHAGALPL